MEVTLIDSMGTDLTVVNAARVSFDKESEWDKSEGLGLSVKDQKLIKYLAKNGHFTPFTHVQVTMREKVPIFVARQRFKHTVGFSYNEVSRRYVDSEPEFYHPEMWRKRADNLKQGSSDEEIINLKFIGRFDDTDSIKEHYERVLEHVQEVYSRMIESGVAPEQARMILPQSMYTEYYVTGSLAAWARAHKLRIDSHAQKEIQGLAKMWNGVFSNILELKYSWGALTE